MGTGWSCIVHGWERTAINRLLGNLWHVDASLYFGSECDPDLHTTTSATTFAAAAARVVSVIQTVNIRDAIASRRRVKYQESVITASC